jgi:predicted O-methyltransferase YrrM
MRYSQLINIVRREQPDIVLEIGTWNGLRAIEMFRANPGMSYIGFDLFEEASDYTDSKEKNVKKHFSAKQVMDKFNNEGMSAALIKGDTTDTFTKWAENHPQSIDLIYIDGGHSVDTISKDYENALKAIKPGGVIVFDDYYEQMDDIDEFGANRVLEASGKEYEILPMADPVVGGGLTKMAVMYL